MNSSNPPTLPTWLFIATDIAAVCLAVAIYASSPQPLSPATTMWIVICVGVGAIAGLVPLVLRYERQKNELLDERQHALESLARTVSSSAEQISIAAKGLHEIADVALKNLRLAEQLPHKLQDKMAEFQSQLAAANDAEKEELERELLALRTTESERLESVSQRIAKSSAEWAKIEATASQHLTSANEAVAKLAFGTASAIGKAQAAAEQALAQARVEAARALGEAGGVATRSVETAKSAALAELDQRLRDAATLLDRMTTELGGKLSAANPPAGSKPADLSTAAETIPDAAAQAARRPRKPRREESADRAPIESQPPVEAPRPATNSTPPVNSPAPFPPVEEPLPIPAAKIPEVTPVAPQTAEPFAGHITNGSAAPVAVEAPRATAPAPETKPAPRRPARKPVADDEPKLGLEIDEPAGGFSPASTERVLSSDGATRLLVTAYIGIGNRLYIRGSGPGLTW